MNARKQVIEVELKTIRIIRLSSNPAVARAARERETELRAELSQDQGAPKSINADPPRNKP